MSVMWAQDGVDRSEASNDMSADPASAGDDYEDQDVRDRQLLNRIANARARGDEIGCLRERTAMGELLAPYWSMVRRVVTWRLASISPDPADVEDISSKVIEHMIKKIKKKTTMAKLTRESRLRERRLDKQAKKDARKQALAHHPDWPGDTLTATTGNGAARSRNCRSGARGRLIPPRALNTRGRRVASPLLVADTERDSMGS
jgi:hypothetical protein